MDLNDIESQEILERIARHCPEAMPAFLQCVNRADSKGKLYLSKSVVEVNMSEGWTKFKNQIKKLAIENILEWHPFNDGIAITIACLYE